MKRILYIIIGMFLSGSCADERTDKTVPGVEETMVNIGIRTYADTEALNRSESRIGTVRIYAFDGNRLDRMVFAEPETDAAATVSMKVKSAPNKTFYVVVNEPASAAGALAVADTPNGLEQVMYSMSGYYTGNAAGLPPNDNSYKLPMFGSVTGVDATGNHPAGSPMALQIPIDRAVARVDVYMKKAPLNGQTIIINASGSLELTQSAAGGYIAPAAASTDKSDARVFRTSAAVTVGTGFDTPVYSFYVPEQACTGSANRLQLALKGVQRGGLSADFPPFRVGETGLAPADVLNKIERNTIHKIYCTFAPEQINIQAVVLPWNVDEEDHGELFPANIYYLDSTLPAVIRQDGLNSGGTFRFYNPQQAPFRMQAFAGENTDTPLNGTLTPLSADAEHTITQFPAYTGPGNRTISFWYQLYGKWYDTGVRALQRSSATINILSVGDMVIGGPTGSTSVDGSPTVNDMWINGIWPLLNNPVNFGETGTATVEAAFKRYHLYRGGADEVGTGFRELTSLAETNKIDIICLLTNGRATPTSQQAAELIDWLNADNTRCLFICNFTWSDGTGIPPDVSGANNTSKACYYLMQALGLETVFGNSSGNYLSLAAANDPVYAYMVENGPFGDARGNSSSYPRGDDKFGAITSATIASGGYVPILNTTPGNAILAVHPQKRIILMGDPTIFLYSGSMGGTGNAYYNARSRLMANQWAWMIDKVVMKR